jgi:hypothetical protein
MIDMHIHAVNPQLPGVRTLPPAAERSAGTRRGRPSTADAGVRCGNPARHGP